jgi:ABC-type nickel/cobalt efflux system permease component RcnA
VSALGLGATHAFEPDHLAAVSAFVAHRPMPRQAVLFGIKWAIGHGISLLLLGSILYILKLTISASVAGSLERLVGAALFGLGLWTLWELRPAEMHHTHTHSHSSLEATPLDATPLEPSSERSHLHTHADGTKHSHPHRHGPLWMGLLHGAAGTAAFVGEVLVAISQTYVLVIAYTLAFSLGVLLAMATYAGLLGGIFMWGSRRYALAIQGARVLAGVLACLVGIYWVFK